MLNNCKIDEKTTAQKTIEKNIYNKTFLRFLTYFVAINVPKGIEINIGVINATPVRPNFFQYLTTFLFVDVEVNRIRLFSLGSNKADADLLNLGVLSITGFK